MPKVLAALLIAVALAPCALTGQRYIGAGGGLVSPQASFGDVDKAGWHVLATGTGRLIGSLGVTVDGLYGQTGHRDGIGGRTALGGGMVGPVLFLGSASRRLQPFVTAGVGVFRVDVSVSGFGSAVATELALGFGGGVLVAVGPRRAFVAARYIDVRTEPEATPFVPISAGLMLPLGFP